MASRYTQISGPGPGSTDGSADGTGGREDGGFPSVPAFLAFGPGVPCRLPVFHHVYLRSGICVYVGLARPTLLEDVARL